MKDTSAKISRTIARLRERRFMTQTNLAIESGLPLIEILEIENPDTEITFSQFAAVADALGMKMSEIAAIAEEEDEKSTSDSEKSSKSMAAAITRLRKERGMKVLDLAKASGLSKSTVLAVENPETQPSFNDIVAIARGLGVRLAELQVQAGHLTPEQRHINNVRLLHQLVLHFNGNFPIRCAGIKDLVAQKGSDFVIAILYSGRIEDMNHLHDEHLEDATYLWRERNQDTFNQVLLELAKEMHRK